ncbi:MAG: sugar ABC transporter permease [Spirochaetaceae bacterium]|jgi:multiple sugar transport system permease protein|nr:sugar ABC transporter permease [Spirochaetaceae bacterium]
MKTGKKPINRRQRSQNINALLFLLPCGVGFLVFIVYPLIVSLVLCFMDWNGFTAMQFVGLDNFARMFRDSNFKIAFWNNIVYTFGTVPLTIVFALLLACVMNAKIKGIGVFRVIFYLPNITAIIAISIVWVTIFAQYGPINRLLTALGVENPPGWINSPRWALPSVMIVSIWRAMGYYAIILLAGLQGIPGTLYEAASIEGAGPFTKFFKITVPMLSPSIFFCVVMNMIASFQVFDSIVAMTQGGPGRATNVLVYHIYITAFENRRFGYASSMAYVLFAVILIFTLIQFAGQKKWVNY